ncbi:MAG: hypothetical protein SCARUB_00383 [Candidatus Scalindua rubra]|uniref:Uncharacterized protein n=1 Tax=Candidatus Scalindua rubra TaxID=1872076 RepID=A0A1E3XFU1_9BACT|nr:MAG: hypothetical protein SCARUB_00383 [Candidatus Scalindua rubra]
MSEKQIEASKEPAELNKMHRCCADCHFFIWLPSTPYSEEDTMSPEDVISYKYSKADLQDPQIRKVKIDGIDYRSQEIEMFFREAIKEKMKCSELFGELDLLCCYAPKSHWREKESMGALDLRTDEGRHKIIVKTDRSNCRHFYKYTEGMDLEEAKMALLGAIQDKKDFTPNILFMDVQKNALFFDKKKIVTLKPEEIKLIEYMRKQNVYELEQILTDHFKKELTEPYKHQKNINEINTEITIKPTLEEKNKSISRSDRGLFDVYKASINKKCKPFGIGDLIIKQGDIKKAFKLSINIEKKTLNLKHS